MSKGLVWRFTVIFVSLLLLGLVAKSVFADGTETLGIPSINIASGSGIVAAGTGMVAQPGSITIDVPTGATVNQVLLYWEGQMSTDVVGDDTIVIDGNNMTGTLIGGPVFFFNGAYSSAFRADITELDLVSAGTNTLTVDGLDFSKIANGAGVLVIFDDGSGTTQIDLRDGLDNAFINFPEPRRSTVPQTITFDPAGADRVADLSMFFSSVAGTVSGADADRPSSIEVTVNGTTTVFSNELASLDGEEWDTVNIDFNIPAGASSLTVQAFSRDDNNTGNLPASFSWTAAGLSILPPATLGDRVWEDRNADGVQNCEDSNNNGIFGDAGDSGAECGAGVPGVTVNLLSPGPDNVCDSGDESFIRDTITDTNGFYGFGDLITGDYCVEFVKATVTDLCDAELGGAMFTNQNTGNDAVDSDANPVSGATGVINLIASETNLTVDAGVYCPAKLGDRVWDDLNRDGIQDNGEPGINGVIAELFVCNANGEPGNNPVAVTTTDTMNGEDGVYMFGELTPDNYAVRFSNLPSGFVFSPTNQGGDSALDSNANTASGFTLCMLLESNQNDPTKDAGLNQPPAGLGDRVWEDKDADGIQEAGEDGISGVTVNLLMAGPDGQCNTGDEVFEAATTTGGDGMYEFLGLDPVRYCVEFDIDSVDICTLGNAKFTAQSQGTDDVDSDADTTTGQTGNIDLGPDGFDSTSDAGVYCSARLGDRVWEDIDKNGIQDVGEPGVDGVNVSLLDCDGNAVATTMTTGGMYQFSDLMPGCYVVDVELLPGFEFAPRNVGGDDSVDSDADQTTGETENIQLASGDENLTVDFGITPIPAVAKIGDRVWKDLDGDGIQDVGEPGVSGVKVSLQNCSGTTLLTTVTGIDGNYVFENLSVGEYVVKFKLLDGFTGFSPEEQGTNIELDSNANQGSGETSCITLAVGENNRTLDAGLIPESSLGDFTWNDLNRDGLQDAGENGIEGVTVRLLNCTGNVVATTITNPSGAYLFDRLLAGCYLVEFEPLSGFVISPQDQGANDDKDSDANPTSGRTGQIALAVGENNRTVDAGMNQPPVAEPGIDIRKQEEGPDFRELPVGSDASFNIVVKNTGAVDLMGVMVADPLVPACDRNIGNLAVGEIISYECSTPLGSGGDLKMTWMDNFAPAGSYYGNDGDTRFSTPWIEKDPKGGGASSGRVMVGPNKKLWLNNYRYSGGKKFKPSARRSVDLSGKTSATLSFNWSTHSGVDKSDGVTLEISSDGGSTYTAIKTFFGKNTYGKQESFDISPYISPNTVIRFRVTHYYGAKNETFKVDNVKIVAIEKNGNPSELVNEACVKGVANGITVSDCDTSTVRAKDKHKDDKHKDDKHKDDKHKDDKHKDDKHKDDKHKDDKHKDDKHKDDKHKDDKHKDDKHKDDKHKDDKHKDDKHKDDKHKDDKHKDDKHKDDKHKEDKHK